MKSIISILWQHETSSILIAPTIIKNSKEQPNFYFYSHKQNRVLRKKPIPEKHTSFVKELIMKQLQIQKIEEDSVKKNKNQNYCVRIIRNLLSSNINFMLVEPSQCFTHIQDSQFQGQFSILKHNQTMFRIKFKIIHESVGQFQFLDSFPVTQFDIDKDLKYKNLKKWCYQIIREIYNNLKNKSKNKQLIPNFQQIQASMDLIISINKAGLDQDTSLKQLSNNIKLIQAIKFSFEIKGKAIQKIGLVSPNMKYHSQNKLITEKNNKKQIEAIYYETAQEKIIAYSPQNKKQNIICKGCEQQFHQQSGKEIGVQQIRSIRKANSLSIRGLGEQFYEVCPQCYSSAF